VITALPPESASRTLSLQLGTDLHALEEMATGLAPLKTERLLSDRDHYQLRLVLDELITNTVSYGFSDGADGTITIDITVQPERLLTVVYRDDGLPFDPLAADVPPEERGTEAVNFGGIGLSLVKSIMDDIAYRRQDDANIITMNKNLAADRPPPTDKEQT
jgi:anti-sigma regulatory factor (Ser/Thr protein kinase)